MQYTKYIRSEAQICILLIIALLLFLHLVFSMVACYKKKIVKVMEDDIQDKLLEILKGSEKFVLAKFHSNADKKIWRLISNKNVKAKNKLQLQDKRNSDQQVEVLLNRIFLKTSRAAVLRYFEKQLEYISLHAWTFGEIV